jgi:pimeloyl-ACP methyl ester carboxylesterase
VNIRQGAIDANGLGFRVLESGEGPLIVLLHGFPDNAWTWERQLPALAEAGYHAVAPFLRGYPPTEIPRDGRYDPGTLAEDLTALIDAFDGGPAHVVGHDWGAVMTYATSAVSPKRVRRSVALAVNHPRTFASLFASPRLIHQNFHQWFFQLEGLAEGALEANDLALIDYLWRYWSPKLDDSEHVNRVKERTLGQPGAVPAALGYYRALLSLAGADPALFQRITAPIEVPTLALFGADDPLAQPADGEAEGFGAAYEQRVIEGCGHFMHRERPSEVTQLILDWLAADDAKPS